MHGGKSKHSLGGSLTWQQRDRQHFPSEHQRLHSFLTLQVNGENLSGVLEALKSLLNSEQGGLLLNQQQGWTRLHVERLPTEKLSRQAGVESSPKAAPGSVPPQFPALHKEQLDRKLLQKINKFLLEKDWRHTGWWQGQEQSLADF